MQIYSRSQHAGFDLAQLCRRILQDDLGPGNVVPVGIGFQSHVVQQPHHLQQATMLRAELVDRECGVKQRQGQVSHPTGVSQIDLKALAQLVHRGPSLLIFLGALLAFLLRDDLA